MSVSLVKLEPSSGFLPGSKPRISKDYVICPEDAVTKIRKRSHFHFMNHSCDKCHLLLYNLCLNWRKDGFNETSEKLNITHEDAVGSSALMFIPWHLFPVVDSGIF